MTTQAVIFRSGSTDETNAGDPLEYVSASRLKSFLQCRLKFYYEKVLGLKSPASPNLQIGKAVHAGLQHFNTARWRGDDATSEQVLEAYHTAYSALEAEDPVEYGDKDRQACIDTGERVLNAFLESDLANDPRRVLGVEVYLRREAGELPLPLVGIVDLVLEGNVPVDYKTIGATPNVREEAWQHDLQLTAYHLLMEDATGEEPGPAELVYLAKLKTPKIIKQELPAVTPVQIDRFKALADAFVEGVTREEYYPSTGMHCRWCSFRSNCAAWKGVIQITNRSA
jgi:CRISPR/Cas system-associated exonuclease Cas4 (RecB family)